MAHNRYSSLVPSGENESVDTEVAALREAGVEVELLQPSSDAIVQGGLRTRVTAAAGVIDHRVHLRQFLDLIDDVRPDLVHVHNAYPLLGPALLAAAEQRGLPLIQSLHNYRFACLKGTYWRDNAECRLCEPLKAPWHGVRHACYRDTRTQSALLAASMWRYRSRRLKVARLLAVSRYLADQAIRYGADARIVAVKPNPVPDPGPPVALPDGRPRFLFAGRLEEQKGVPLLLDAWAVSAVDAELHIAGHGELAGVVRDAARRDARVHFHGNVPRAEVSALMAQSCVIVVPSVCAETFSLAAVESMAHGRPVVATTVGGVPEVVHDSGGWLAEPTVEGLSAALIRAASAKLSGPAARARQRYLDNYAPGTVVRLLIGHYEQTLANARR